LLLATWRNCPAPKFFRIAVGTAVASCHPHRSVLKENERIRVSKPIDEAHPFQEHSLMRHRVPAEMLQPNGIASSAAVH
jgi:hypothetical protein